MSTTTTYPNGQQLISDALTVEQINTVIVTLTQGMLGLSLNENSPSVRVGWPTQGQPFQDAFEDVCYLRCTPVADPYDLIRDIVPTQTDEEDAPLIENQASTRAWTIHWTIYGPNSTDRARMIRSALYQDYFSDQLALSQLFPVSAFPQEVRVPENINGQWFERVDLEVEFYEFITETIIDQSVESVEVIGSNSSGEIFDVTVEQ